MQIILNGRIEELTGAQRLAELLRLRNPRPPFAVEVNRHLVKREDYDAVPLRDGDEVEIVTLVGGG